MSLSHDHVEALIAEARAGSKKALGELLQVFRVDLERMAKRQMGADLLVKTAASEAVQETLLTALTVFPAFKGHTQKQFWSWLTRILYHRVEDLRKQFHSGKRDVGREIPLTDAIAKGLKAEEGENGEKKERRLKEQWELIRQTYWRLPEPYRQVIKLHYIEGRPFTEIAAVMQRSVPAAKKLCSRAFQLWSKNSNH
jgi:RNA polymerase sigma-70 factor (subfamily 1)